MAYIFAGHKLASDLQPGDLVWKGFSGSIRHLSAVLSVDRVENSETGVLIQARHPELGRISPDFRPNEQVSLMKENWAAEGGVATPEELLAAFEGLVQPETDDEREAREWEAMLLEL